MLASATAAVVIMAVTATGLPVNHVSANDGGVWLTNDQPSSSFRGSFAEFNVPIKQLGYTFGAPGQTLQPSYDLDVLQQGTTVLAVDRGKGALYAVDSRAGLPDTSGGITFPTGSQVAFGGDVAAILQPATTTTPARVWAQHVGSGPLPAISQLNTAAAKPLLKSPGLATMAVDDQGDIFLASRSDLVTIPSVGTGFGPPRTVPFASPLSSVAVTAVGATPVVLDPAEKVVHFPLSRVSVTLPADAGGAKSAVLQQAGPDDPAVVVATESALVSVPLNGQMPTVLAHVPSGQPAAPARLDGCAYGAWSGSPGQAAQDCEDGIHQQGALPAAAGSSSTLTRPVFRVNHDQIILNDEADGEAWTVVGRPAQVLTDQQWLQALVGNNQSQSNDSNGATNQPDQAKRQPKLANPTLYARAGVQSVLHILDSDSDPGGSILSIASVTPANGAGFSVRISPDTQTVVLSLDPGASAPISFNYQVVDGFGLTASGPVTVVPTTGEQPPAPIGAAPAARPVVSGGTVSMQVLGNWRDADSDPLSVADATVPGDQGQVSWTSDGLITFKAPVETSDTPVSITYHVTDGRSPGVAGQIPLTVLGRGDTQAFPPTGVPDAVQILVNRPTDFAPLANDTFGADPNQPGAKLGLAGPVASTTGITVSTSLSSGHVVLNASQPGTYSLQYEASYGSAVSASTQLLVQAVAPPDNSSPPVTTPQAVMLHGQYPATIDVLSEDYDPAGGLLTVVGVTAPSGIQATVVQGEYLRLVAATSAPPTSQVVTYQVTNGRNDPVTGQVTVLWQAATAPTPPVVPAVYATARAGDEVDVPVLGSATDPDGESIHLLGGGVPQAVLLAQTDPGPPYAGGLGSASVSGGYIRYSAPPGGGVTAPESVTASYVVESQSGLRTTGQVFLSIVPDSPADTTTPEPQEVDARVSSGGTVTVPIPTTGVDPDGDSVSFTGITSAPQMGRILSSNANSITYQAFPTVAGTNNFAGGTDSFNYQVEGPSGLTAQAEVRVGISPPGQPQAPVATDRYVTATPSSDVSVNLLAGDYITPGDTVTVQPLAATNSPVPAGASLGGSGTDLQVTAPKGADPLSVAYGLTDGLTRPSVAHVVVRSETGYVTPPVATDYYPTAPDAGAKTISVNVLSRDSDPGGAPGDLTVVGSPSPGVTVSGGTLVIPVGPDPRSVPYVIRSGTTDATAVGVIHVLGTSMGPALKAGQTVQVPAGGTTTVNIGDYITEAGHQIRLTTNDQVSAAPTGGLNERVDSNTSVTLTSVGSYSGPGNLTVQVTDQATLSAPGARTVTLSIPVQVGSPTPVVHCPSAPITVAQDGGPVDVAIASVCQVWTPDGSNPQSVAFSENWSQQPPGVNLGWKAGQTGHVIELTAGASAKGGTNGTISVTVAGAPASSASTLNVTVTAAPPPTATPADPPAVQTGQTAAVDMAQYVHSALASPQIYVVSVQQTGGDPTPAASSGSVVRITPHTGTSGTVTYAVVVSDDGPNRPDRYVNDSITLQVLDVPGVPTNLQGTPGNGQVALTWTASNDNGAPVEHYIVAMGGSSQQVPGTAYTWTGLQNGQPYSFTVTAVNQVGSSPPSASASFTPRSAPDAPTSVTASSTSQPQGTATVSWTPGNANGQPITGYTVYVSPAAGGAATMQTSGTSLTWTGLDDSVGPYSFTVIAHNSVGSSPSSAPSNQVYAHGVPVTPAAPSASGQVSTDQSSTTITVSWPAVSNCNDAQPCASYTVSEYKNGSQVTTSQSTGGTASFGPISNDGATYTYTLSATNREGQTSTASAASSPGVKAVGVPAAVTDLKSTDGNTTAAVTFTLPASHGASISIVKYTATGGSSPVTGAWSSPGASGQPVAETISGLINGTTYSITVSACNEAAECGASSNTVTADPYGPPNPPSVTASTGETKAVTFTWTGGGNNGRPVASYNVCTSSAPTGGSPTCSTKGGTAGSETITYNCSVNNITITATVTDTVGQTSASSVTATGSTKQCLPPGPPNVAATASGDSITYSWSGGGGSGLPVASYTLCIDGSCSNVGATPGSTTDTYGCGQTHSAYGYDTDTAGQNSTNSSPASATTVTCPTTTTSTTVPPATGPYITASQGPSASGCTTAASCHWLAFQVHNFPTGHFGYSCITDGGVSYSSSLTVTSANESFPGNSPGYCYWGAPYGTEAISINGVTSNAVQHTP